MPLTDTQRTELLTLARRSIAYGLSHSGAVPVDATGHPPFDRPGASFVTLHRSGQLRGCIGSLEPRRPLFEDVAENAHAAAFRDPRFPPLQAGELDDLDIDVSILSPASALSFDDERDLLRQLRPNVDGLILEDRGRRGTFLPSVWASLPQPEQFWRQLKLKAGLPVDHWSDSLRVWRYTTESFGDSYDS